MNEIDAIKKEIEEAQEKLVSAQDRLKALEEQKHAKGFWIPAKGEDYYTIDNVYDIECDRWDGCSIDLYRLRHNNIFKSKADAQRKLDIETRLFEIAGDVDYEGRLYFIEYFRDDKTLRTEGYFSRLPFSQIVSNDPEFYNKAISKIGETDLKWFYSYGWRRV